MNSDIRNVKDMTDLISYFSQNMNWNIDIEDFDDIQDISYDFDAEEIGLKEEAFAKIASLRQLQPLVDNQKWGIFCVEFDSIRFEVSALRKILSGLIPKRRNSMEHAVWSQQDLLFICIWGDDNNRTIGIAHFKDKESGLPQIKMISCAPALEDFTQIKVFEERLSKLAWPENTDDIEGWRKLWSDAFVNGYHQTIQDSSTLTIQLATEAQNIRNRILDILNIESANGYVHLLYEKFKDTLIHDMTVQQFADMYAQTVVYGLFSARCMGNTQDDFSAEEAVKCIPNTNPFLKNLIRECLGFRNNSKLSFDELEIGNVVELLLHTRTDAIIQDFNRQTGGGREDPVIHFYEEFLEAYDKVQKAQRGVFYTPQPVVNFMIRAIDYLVCNEFNMKDGLATMESKKIQIKRKSKKKIDGFIKMVDDIETVPAIQILDPATGTGTFLRQVILQIYENFCKKNKGISNENLRKEWNKYVDDYLLYIINGFELMMAPYAVAHMKLAMVLKDTGYDFSKNSRLRVYLTNSLEEAGKSDEQFALWDDPITAESMQANVVKQNIGINIVVGNPPYNISSNNKNEWIQGLISDYKVGLKERKLNLDDDYIKFLKLAQTIVEKTDNGIVAYITNNSYIDGVSHRRIRESLMNTFNQIYILDLHGNVMKQEKTINGEKDENIFDITQGVSICFLVRNKNAKSFVKHFSLLGNREAKYRFLNENTINNIMWNELEPKKPEYLFIPYKVELKEKYEQGFNVSELFVNFNSGIQTKCDEISVCRTVKEVENIINLFSQQSLSKIRETYPNKNDGRDWTFELAQKDILNNNGKIVPYYYRPFDVRYIRYSGQTKGLIAYPRRDIMNHMILYPNLSLCMMKQFFQDVVYNHIFVSNLAIDERMLYSNRGGTYIFPLYQYYEFNGEVTPRYNFNNSIIREIEINLGMKLVMKKENYDEFTGEELLQYIYAVLYSRKYREKFNDQLKYNFPSIPYPVNKQMFQKLVRLGKRLIEIHLPDKYYRKEDSPLVLQSLQSYKFIEDRIVLNDVVSIQAFAGMKEKQLGGYRPADKWLKDRKGKEITESDIEVYKHIIDALLETDSIMDEIENILFF